MSRDASTAHNATKTPTPAEAAARRRALDQLATRPHLHVVREIAAEQRRRRELRENPAHPAIIR